MTTERRPRGRPPHPDVLTPREWQVLDLLREGLTNEQIAQRLDVSLATAKYHVSEILTKLGLTSREEAAAWQPEPVPIRWWQRAFAWVPRRAWPLAGAATALAAVALLAWLVLRPSAGEDSPTVSQPSTSPTAPETALATPTPIDVSFPPLSISNPEDTKLLFIRGATDFFGPGSLWMSDLDGSSEEALIPEPLVERVIGVVTHWQTGNATVYYYNSRITAENREGRFGVHTVSSLDLTTRVRADVHSFELRNTQLEGAEDVSDDGRYLAFADNFGLAVLDTATGETTRVLESDPPGHCSTDLGRCLYYAQPRWSPEGRFLLVFQGGYEGGYTLLLDPFADSPAPIAFFEPSAWRARWSPSAQSLCVVDVGDYDHEVGVIIAKAPDWQAQKYLADYQPELPSNVHLFVKSLLHCIWLDDVRVALFFGSTIEPAFEAQRPHNELLILDTSSGTISSLQEHRLSSGLPPMVAVANRNLLISGPQSSSTPDTIGDTLTPEVVDVETNARRPILTTEDWVVAAVPAESIQP